MYKEKCSTKRGILLSLVLMLISLNVLSQQASVSGLITDTSGQPLPGVTVAVKGTTQGTVTNQDGEYILNNVPGDAVLVVSFVGMRTQEISVNGRTVINASLSEEAIGLDEVVVTALGITRDKKQLNYSIQQIDGELVGTTGNIDVSRGLQGKIAGVTVRQTSGAPGKTPKVTIRGSNSITGSNAPLYVVDGSPVDANIALNISPNEIENVSVLKGASASALYGLR